MYNNGGGFSAIDIQPVNYVHTFDTTGCDICIDWMFGTMTAIQK